MAIHDPIVVGPNNLILQDGGRVDRPPYECDVVTARWKVKTTLIEQLLPKWGASHPTWNQLRKTTHTFVSEKFGWTTLDCTYRGVIGEMPKVKIIPGQSIGTATLERLGAGGSAEEIPSSLEIQFYTPTTTYEYYVKKQPKGPIFKGRLVWLEDSLELIGRRGAGQNRDDVTILSGKSIAMSKADGGRGDETSLGRKIIAEVGSYNGVAEIVTGNFKADPMAEGLWKCAETNQIQVIPYGFERVKRVS